MLSRNKKAKSLLKLFRKVIEGKPTNIIMLLQRSAHRLVMLGSFLAVDEVGNSKCTDHGAGSKQMNINHMFHICIADPWKSLLEDAVAASS